MTALQNLQLKNLLKMKTIELSHYKKVFDLNKKIANGSWLF